MSEAGISKKRGDDIAMEMAKSYFTNKVIEAAKPLEVTPTQLRIMEEAFVAGFKCGTKWRDEP